jgi:predicted heme/steroid binding protein
MRPRVSVGKLVLTRSVETLKGGILWGDEGEHFGLHAGTMLSASLNEAGNVDSCCACPGSVETR